MKSVPFPTRIDWFEQTCESPVNCNIQNDKWKPVVVTDVTSAVYPKQVNFKADHHTTNISQLIIKDTTVGSYKYYKCEGQNKVGSNSAPFSYVATGILLKIDLILFLNSCFFPINVYFRSLHLNFLLLAGK